MKVVHFALDEKFIPFIQDTFEEAFPGGNEYRILGDPAAPLQFVRAGPEVRVAPASYWNSQALREELEQFDCLVVHFMTPAFATAIRGAPADLLVCWVGWGGDYADLIEPWLGELLMPRTRALAKTLARTRIRAERVRTLKRGPAAWYRSGRDLLFSRQRGNEVESIAGRIDLLWVNPEEKEMIERALPSFRGDYHRLCYYSAEDTFAVGPDQMAGPDILVGNSAFATNNHLEVFDLLAELDLVGRRLIVPLSYGDGPYADAIEQVGRKRFGDRFFPIRRFMPVEDYYQAIESCGTVVMNHVRQQGGATIATALYKGARVFLRDENPAAPFYRGLGVKLYSVQQDFSALNANPGPDPEEMVLHRRILRDFWSRDVAVAAAVELERHVKRKLQVHA